MIFYENVDDGEKKEKLMAVGAAAVTFITRMFHCFYNKKDYAEAQAGGLTAGCSAPLRVN